MWIETSQVNTSLFKPNRNQNGHFEQNKVKEMKRLPTHQSIHCCKLHFKISEKEKTKINVGYAGTQTCHLWEISLGSKPNQFCEFYLSIPRSQIAKHFLPDLQCSCQKAKTLRVHYRSSVLWCRRDVCGDRGCHSRGWLHFFFFYSRQSKKSSWTDEAGPWKKSVRQQKGA